LSEVRVSRGRLPNSSNTDEDEEVPMIGPAVNDIIIKSRKYENTHKDEFHAHCYNEDDLS